MKNLLKKYNHALAFLYLPLYLICFFFLEGKNTTDYYIMESTFDKYIPFCEIFIIPYVLWFAFIAAAVLYFFFTNKRDFTRLCIFLFTGMTVCLVIYYFWPNGHHLRPDLTTLGRENIFTKLVAFLYAIDTPTNVCPSIHVLNSVGVCISIFHSNTLQDKKWLRIGTLLLTIAICLSTVFLKQHSLIDVFCGLMLSIVMYWISYRPKLERIPEQLIQDTPA